MPKYWEDVIAFIKQWYSKAAWYEVYDFIELLAEQLVNDNALRKQGEILIKSINDMLESEMSAYRFVGSTIGELTSGEEISAIEDALKKTGPLEPVYAHLKDSLSKLTDRSNPDYRNSIKESVSAVEALCRLITKNPSATLAEALKKIEDAGVQLPCP
jgi:hypothetical protein